LGLGLGLRVEGLGLPEAFLAHVDHALILLHLHEHQGSVQQLELCARMLAAEIMKLDTS